MTVASRGRLAALAFLVTGTAYPLVFGGDYMVHLGVLVCVYVVLTSSLNLIVGYTGQFAVAHASFYGIGAYGAVLLATRVGVPYWAASGAAVLLAGLCGSAAQGLLVQRFLGHGAPFAETVSTMYDNTRPACGRYQKGRRAASRPAYFATSSGLMRMLRN